jgi:hypothetical protein
MPGSRRERKRRMNPGAIKPSSANSATAGPEIPVPSAAPFETPAPPGMGARSGSGVAPSGADDASVARTRGSGFETWLTDSACHSSNGRPETSGSAAAGPAATRAPGANRADVWWSDGAIVKDGDCRPTIRAGINERSGDAPDTANGAATSPGADIAAAGMTVTVMTPAGKRDTSAPVDPLTEPDAPLAPDDAWSDDDGFVLVGGADDGAAEVAERLPDDAEPSVGCRSG